MLRIHIAHMHLVTKPQGHGPMACQVHDVTTEMGLSQYTVSNVTLVDEKFNSLQQYLRYCHKSGTIAFGIPGAILRAKSHISSTISYRLAFLGHATYS